LNYVATELPENLKYLAKIADTSDGVATATTYNKNKGGGGYLERFFKRKF